jgi:23S rRNA (adenine2503-C2)-methyltransferase
VGCPLGCTFCLTGTMGFKRNLSACEIVEQVLFFCRHLKKRNEKVTNIVFMGMGEPLLNYDEVIKSIEILHDPEGLNIGSRKISISTAGIIPGIKKLAEYPRDVNLALSLHAPDDALRSKLMSINKKYPIKEVFKALRLYIKKTSRKVMIEYVMLDKVNDSEECAEKLADLIGRSLIIVNLIPYNFTGNYRSSSKIRIQAFKDILKNRDISVSERYRFGTDIKAACGQLVIRT